MRQARSNRRARAGAAGGPSATDRRDQRGSVLLIALLVMLGLTSLAMVAARNVHNELSFAGNLRKSSSAYRMAQNGAYGAMAHVLDQGPEAFASGVSEQLEQDPAEATGSTHPDQITWYPRDLVDTIDYFDMAKTGSFGYEGTLSSDGEEPMFDFEVDVTRTGIQQPLAGYSASGPDSKCRVLYRFDAEGNVGSQDRVSGAPNDAAREVMHRVRAYAYVGPLPCSGTGAQQGEI